MSCGGEHGSFVSSQHFQPGCDIGCVIFAGFQSKFQVGAQESGPEFGNQLLDSVTFAPEAMSAEVTVEPGLAACPVGAFMGKRRVITVSVLEALEWRHLDRIGGDTVERSISAVSPERRSISKCPDTVTELVGASINLQRIVLLELGSGRPISPSLTVA